MSDRDAEAAHWFARMRASDAATDRAAFDAWHADPANAEAYAHAEEDWLLTAGVAPEYLAAHRKPTGKPALSRAHWALAASLILAISITFAWAMLGNRGAEPIVAENSTGDLLLEDGTRVALMDGAKLYSHYGPEERRVTLSGGRARFTVAHDAARPFRVEADGSETTALGTIFEVDLMGREPVVHLIEGSVEIRATAMPHGPLRLRPGQRATVANSGPKIIETTADGNPATKGNPAGAGTASLLVADNLPLGAVIDRANRVNAAKIELIDAALANRLVSGQFDVADAQSLARKLAAALDLDLEERGSCYILKAK